MAWPGSRLGNGRRSRQISRRAVRSGELRNSCAEKLRLPQFAVVQRRLGMAGVESRWVSFGSRCRTKDADPGKAPGPRYTGLSGEGTDTDKD